MGSCAWCWAPATGELVDRRYTRFKSGGMVKSGTGKRYPVCAECEKRLDRSLSIRQPGVRGGHG